MNFHQKKLITAMSYVDLKSVYLRNVLVIYSEKKKNEKENEKKRTKRKKRKFSFCIFCHFFLLFFFLLFLSSQSFTISDLFFFHLSLSILFFSFFFCLFFHLETSFACAELYAFMKLLVSCGAGNRTAGLLCGFFFFSGVFFGKSNVIFAKVGVFFGESFTVI